MLSRFLITAFGLLGCVGALFASELTNVTYDTHYDLFYQEPFHALLPRVQKAVPEAYDKILQRWGLKDTGGLHSPLTVQIEKIQSRTLQRWEAAYVEARGDGSSLRQRLVVDIGTYQQNPTENVEMVVTHEMSHVILRDLLNGSKAKDIPPWFNEGLAQSITREGWERVRSDIQGLQNTGGTLRLCVLDGPLDEFAHGPFNGNCYPEFYLAVKRLEQLGGPQTIQNAILGLYEGKTMPELVQSMIHMDWPAFKNEVDRYTKAVFDESVPVP